MKIIKILFKYLLITFVVLVISSPVWINKVPLHHLFFLVGKSQVADKYLCKYPIQVKGDSMSPVITQGSSIELDRCFDESDLSEGMVVLFGKDSEYHLGIIRHILALDPIIYKISNERPNERLQDIVKEEIIAIDQDIDTSNSSYQLKDSLESLILDPNEYLVDFYLGKIPKGYGEEMAEVEKTTTFLKDKDKFCMVVIPKKELAFVETDIIDAKTKETLTSHKNIVFKVQPKPNTNCSDFGTGQGMFDLSPGNYHYRFILNHQVLADIPFRVE